MYFLQGRGTRKTGRTLCQVHHVVGRLDQAADVEFQRFGAVRVRGVRLLVTAAGRRPVAAERRQRGRPSQEFGVVVVVVAAPPSGRGRRGRSRGT